MIWKFLKHKQLFENDVITEINYSFEKLTKLPYLPDTLEILNCSNNNLTKITNLPEPLESLDCSDNPNLSFLLLPDNIEDITITNTNLPYDDIDEYEEWFENEFNEENYPEEYAEYLKKEKIIDFNL